MLNFSYSYTRISIGIAKRAFVEVVVVGYTFVFFVKFVRRLLSKNFVTVGEVGVPAYNYNNNV